MIVLYTFTIADSIKHSGDYDKFSEVLLAPNHDLAYACAVFL